MSLDRNMEGSLASSAKRGLSHPSFDELSMLKMDI
jgi:hypothetical protein